MTVASPTPDPPARLRLLGRFDLIGVHARELGHAGQRLFALVAVHAGTVARWQAAQMLYPHATDVQAASNLRAVLWRLHRCCPGTIDATTAEIRLAPGVGVDHWTAIAAAHQLLSTPGPDAGRLTAASAAHLREDLLPGWPDPWLVHDREQFHQLRLHALEALGVKLTAAGSHGTAVDVALTAVNADPLRESARRVLIDAHLAEGNTGEALRQYEAFRVLLYTELGLRPTDALREHLTAGTTLAATPGGRLRSST